MKLILQRVKKASVSVDNKTVGKIDQGLLAFFAAGKNSNPQKITSLAQKMVNLRIFEDKDGRFNLSALDISADILIISQFTLYANCRKGRRPDFLEAASPDVGNDFYQKFVAQSKEFGLKVETGIFGAHMDIELVNDGPVTIILNETDVK